MDNPMSQNRETEWIERIKSKGPVPYLDSKHFCSSPCWVAPPGDTFLVRGPRYPKIKSKIPGGDYLLKPLGFDWIKGPTKISNVLNNPRHRIRASLDSTDFPEGARKPFVWAFNFQLPTKDNHSIVAYFVDTEQGINNALVNKFLKEGDVFKNSRLKLIVNILKGPWAVKKAIGEQAISLIGRSLTCRYCQGEDYMEVDMDIGSSVLATALTHLAIGFLATMTVDVAYLIEGRGESELPERLLGAVRFSNIDAASAEEVG